LILLFHAVSCLVKLAESFMQRMFNPDPQPQSHQHMSQTQDTANPAPLGLLGFGMTTVLLNIHTAGFFGLSSMILAMGIWYGGLAQIIAGIMEWRKGNTFGMLAFTSYGLFWISLVAMTVMPKVVKIDPPDSAAMAAYLFMWGLFTLVMFIGTLKLNRALQIVFASLTILFFLLAFGRGAENEDIVHIAGYEGIFCGLCAMYAGLAQVLNDVHGKVLWPLGTK